MGLQPLVAKNIGTAARRRDVEFFGAFLLSGSVRAKQAQIETRGGGEEIALHSNAWFVKHKSKGMR